MSNRVCSCVPMKSFILSMMGFGTKLMCALLRSKTGTSQVIHLTMTMLGRTVSTVMMMDILVLRREGVPTPSPRGRDSTMALVQALTLSSVWVGDLLSCHGVARLRILWSAKSGAHRPLRCYCHLDWAHTSWTASVRWSSLLCTGMLPCPNLLMIR